MPRSRSRISTEQARVQTEQHGHRLPRGQQPRTPSENIEAAVVPAKGPMNATLTPGDALGSVKPAVWRGQRQVLEPYSY